MTLATDTDPHPIPSCHVHRRLVDQLHGITRLTIKRDSSLARLELEDLGDGIRRVVAGKTGTGAQEHANGYFSRSRRHASRLLHGENPAIFARSDEHLRARERLGGIRDGPAAESRLEPSWRLVESVVLEVEAANTVGGSKERGSAAHGRQLGARQRPQREPADHHEASWVMHPRAPPALRPLPAGR